jgi:hypothetical protein
MSAWLFMLARHDLSISGDVYILQLDAEIENHPESITVSVTSDVFSAVTEHLGLFGCKNCVSLPS